MSTVAELSVAELLDLAWYGTGPEARAAAIALHERYGFGLWVDAPAAVDDTPSDWHADRAADAWERGRDRVAERAR